MKLLPIFISLLFSLACTCGRAQSITTYFTGSRSDAETYPTGGICLMGGATEDDNAMRWFLRRADGGDVLVLRASGSDGYNDYFFSDLNVNVNSVETIVFNNANGANDPRVHEAIQQAEAIWFAGGDQSTYLSYWRGTTVDSLIRSAVQDRNIVIGGTSAGMAILGGFQFSAAGGTIRSPQALADPFDPKITIDSARFLAVPYLENVITDTHYDDPDRRGRHVAFLARIGHSFSATAYGIACDEYTAVCLTPEGIGRVYGDGSEEDYAYFLQANCDAGPPETLANGQPLTWDHNGKALKVYRIQGNATGLRTFDLNDWQTGSGGEWLHWFVRSGTFNNLAGTAPECSSTAITTFVKDESVVVAPNPVGDTPLRIEADWPIQEVRLVDTNGRLVQRWKGIRQQAILLPLDTLTRGSYQLLVKGQRGWVQRAIIR
ncbi:MAG: cyanophycinase [Bacteroidota bacterium]